MRRLGLTTAALSIVCLGVLSSSEATGAVSTSSWSQPQGDAAHSNRNNAETTITAATVAGLAVRYSVGRLPDYSVCGRAHPHAAVATASRLYVFDGRRVVATDLATGQQLWRGADLGGTTGFQATDLAVSGSRVVVQGSGGCLSQSDPGLRLVGLDAATGATVWSVQRGGYNRSMVVSGSTVVSDNDDISGVPSVVAYDLTTGAQRWVRSGCVSSGFGPDAGLFASDDNILTTCGALSFARRGATSWSKPAGWSFLRADPSGTVSPNVYARNPAGRITALSPTGAVRWTSTESGPLLAAGPVRLIVGCGATNVCALNRATGARVWTSARSVAPTAAVLAADLAYVTPGEAPLVAATGRPVPGADSDFLSPYGYLADGAVEVAGGRLVNVTRRAVDVYALTP
ncbi:hypothetical protein GCM10023258_15280 [Terrabacter aeriphilus]|uniref:Pyrrolo-quinoline quinone repeat domain-containing protein n=1 Tax=Terrabacter aeriphilus TaxID=515662 RepID=A0ABP9JAB0_9MICO